MRKFTWDFLYINDDLTCDFETAYIISCDECKNKENVIEYIKKVSGFDDDQLNKNAQIYKGWCSFQIRRDWEGRGAETHGGYIAEFGENPPKRRGCFPVWIVKAYDVIIGENDYDHV